MQMILIQRGDAVQRMHAAGLNHRQRNESISLQFNLANKQHNRSTAETNHASSEWLARVSINKLIVEAV